MYLILETIYSVPVKRIFAAKLEAKLSCSVIPFV